MAIIGKRSNSVSVVKKPRGIKTWLYALIVALAVLILLWSYVILSAIHNNEKDAFSILSVPVIWIVFLILSVYSFIAIFSAIKYREKFFGWLIIIGGVFFVLSSMKKWYFGEFSPIIDEYFHVGVLSVGIAIATIGFRILNKNKLAINDSQVQGEKTLEQQPISGMEISKEYLDQLRKDRDALINADLEQSKSFDKYILTLSGGAFGLSLVFIRDIVSKSTPVFSNVLYSAWILFGVSISITLVSFLLSQKACKRQIEINEIILLNKSFDNVPQNTYSRFTNLANWISGCVFVSGLFCLASFAFNNIG
jgi:hypothetical protein